MFSSHKMMPFDLEIWVFFFGKGEGSQSVQNRIDFENIDQMTTTIKVFIYLL